MASIPHVRLIDDATGNEVAVTAAGDAQVTPTGRAAEGAAVAGNPITVGLEDTAGNAQFLQGDTAGNLFVAGPDADGAASTANPVLIGGEDNVGNVQTLSTDTSGNLNVNVVSEGSNETVTLDDPAGQSLAAGVSGDFDTADIASANESDLRQLVVSGTQPWTATVSTVEDGTATVVARGLSGQAGESVIWDIPQDAISLNGGNAGLDAFRVTVTNEDNNKTGDFDVIAVYFTAP